METTLRSVQATFSHDSGNALLLSGMVVWPRR